MVITTQSNLDDMNVINSRGGSPVNSASSKFNIQALNDLINKQGLYQDM